MLKIIHLPTNKQILKNTFICDSFFKRLLGLMFKKSWPQDYDALLFFPCKQIHSFFVFFPFEAIFLNKEKTIIWLNKFNPWRIGPYIRKGYYLLEVPVGTIDKLGLKVNDKLLFSHVVADFSPRCKR